MFAHSLELECLVKDLCKGDPGLCGLLPKMRQRFNHYREKFEMQPGFNPVGMDHFTDEEVVRIGEDLAGLLQRPSVTVRFVSREAVAKTVRDGARGSDPAANDLTDKTLLKIALEHSLRSKLDMSFCEPWKVRQFNGRKLEDIISSMLGKRSMQQVMDQGFGHSFANIFLRDALALWDCYVCSILEGRKEQACRYGRIIDVCASIVPIGEDVNAPDSPFLFFTH